MLGALPRTRSKSRSPQTGRVDGGNIQDLISGSVSSAAARPARAIAAASTAAARTVARLGLTGPFIARAPSSAPELADLLQRLALGLRHLRHDEDDPSRLAKTGKESPRGSWRPSWMRWTR